jgi:hypothetical protein
MVNYLVQGNKREGLGQVKGGCTGVDCAVERCSNAVFIERTENAQSQGPKFLFVGAKEQRDNYFTKCEGFNAEWTVITPRLNVRLWSAPLT